MTDSIIVTGIILSVQSIGEYDRRILLLTKERGKIAAFAKGVRRPTAALVGVTQPFLFGRFTLIEGKTSFTFLTAEVKNFFSELREDLTAMTYGIYFCELADAVTREGAPAKEELKVLYRSLCALSRESIGKPLVRIIYELRLLSVTGISPQVFECICCKGKEELVWFSAEEGGCICSRCRKTERFQIARNGLIRKLSKSALYTLQFVLYTPIESLYTFTVTEEVRNELELLMEDFLLVHIGKQFKSLSMLTELCSMQ